MFDSHSCNIKVNEMKPNKFSKFDAKIVKAVSEGSEAEVDIICENYVKALVKSNADQGETPLQIAARSGFAEICKLLIDNGANINIGNKRSLSPLMLAASNNHIESVRLLLDHGAVVSRCDVEYTAADEADSQGHKEIKNLINSHLVNEALDFFMETQVSEDPEISVHLKNTLYKILVNENKHPVRLMLHLKENAVFLENIDKFIEALKLICEQQMEKANNQRLSWMCHNIGFFLSVAQEFLSSKKGCSEDGNTCGPSILDPLIKSWLNGQPRNGYSTLLLNHLQEAILAYPFKNSYIYRVLTFVPVNKIYKEFTLFDTCETCRNPNGLKRCERCKRIKYCGQNCQKLHWFVHRIECNKARWNIPPVMNRLDKDYMLRSGSFAVCMFYNIFFKNSYVHIPFQRL